MLWIWCQRCSYSLQPILINLGWTDYEWIRVVEFQHCWLIHIHTWMLMSSEKTYTYKSAVNWLRMNQSSWISILLSHSYSQLHEYIWVAKKRFIADLWSVIYVDNISYFGSTVCFWQINIIFVFWCTLWFFSIRKSNGSKKLSIFSFL